MSEPTAAHPLHFAVGQALLELKSEKITPILDPACGGQEHICLYGDEPAAVKHKMVQVDAAILTQEEISVVIEIEESNLKPLQFCGKALATAGSKYYQGRRGKFPLRDGLLFVQIFNKKVTHADWSKLHQCRYLEDAITSQLTGVGKRIGKYTVHFGTEDEFCQPEHKDALLEEIRGFLAGPLGGQ